MPVSQEQAIEHAAKVRKALLGVERAQDEGNMPVAIMRTHTLHALLNEAAHLLVEQYGGDVGTFSGGEPKP